MNKYLSLFLALSLMGCAGQAINSIQTENKDYKVELLFKYDGCSVYRFEDERPHYFVKCRSGEQSVSESDLRSCGKTCFATLTQETPTAMIKTTN